MGKQPELSPTSKFGQNGCIFCNKTSLTREHVFPDWIKTIISRTGPLKTKQYIRNIARHEDNIYIKPTEKTIQGYVGNRCVKVVCGDCNNGWMNRIEEKARPILTPLILGESYVIDKDDQQILASWAILRTIIGELMNNTNSTISFEERNEFYSLKQPYSNWKIFIGRLSNQSNLLRYRHVRQLKPIMNGNDVIYPANHDSNNKERNVIFTTYVVGELLFYTFKSIQEDYTFYFNDPIQYKLYQIYPSIHSTINWNKIVVFSESDYHDLWESHNNYDFKKRI